MLKSLKKQRIGTSCVESLATRICRYKDSDRVFKNSVKEKVVKIVMSEKVNDAYAEYRLCRRKDNDIWKESKKKIKGEVRRKYVKEWKRFMKVMLKRLENKENKKVEWLVSKWKREDLEVPEVYEGITIKSEEEYPPEFDNDPRRYGGVILHEDEQVALKLPPKFGLTEEVNVTECRIQLEEALNKLRWNKIIKEDEQTSNFYNANTKTMNIKTMQVTSLPFNPGVRMPWALEEKEEVKLAKFRTEVMEAVKGMKKIETKWSNLSVEERSGLMSLKKRVKEGDIVCCITDKSGRWSCDTRENYLEACMNELEDQEKTPEITLEEHENGEKELNCHAAALLRMMGLEAGEDDEGESRLRLATQAKGTGLAPFYGLRKDHKEVPPDKVDKGPQVRPICGAEECSTKRVSYILCQVLTPLVVRGSTQCDSTDELLREIEVVNKEREADPRWVVGSLDINSLYPSLDIEVCSIVISKELIDSDLVFENLSWHEIALYLRYNMDEEQLECWTALLDVQDITQWCPWRKNVRGRPPTFETSESSVKKDARFDPWVFPEGSPTDAEVRVMFCIAIGFMVKRTMELHDFCIDGRIFRQKKGGSIGLDLTGVVSDIFMGRWDKLLLEKMAMSEIDAVVYKRYKDDVNLVLEAGGEESEAEVDEGRNRRIMGKMEDLANTTHASLSVTVDCGFNHPIRQGRTPSLDVEIWIGQAADGSRRTLHSHYMKDVATKLTIERRSAHGENTKRNVMVNELCRIMKNCSVYLAWEEVAEKVSYFVRRMAYCGYDERFRYEVVRIAVGRHKRRLEKWSKGQGMFEELRTEGERAEAKKRKRDWYKEDKRYDSVMFVQPTEKSQLKNKVQQIARRNGVKVKVVEKAGQTVKKVLQRSNPFGKKVCGREDCLVCKVGKPGDCRKRGCVDQLKCKADKRKYRGQTGRSTNERFKEEMKDWWNREEWSPLWRHSELYHEGGDFEVEFEVIGDSFGKPSRRMITEAVLIEQLKENETMNSKQEWTYTKLNKIHTS